LKEMILSLPGSLLHLMDIPQCEGTVIIGRRFQVPRVLIDHAIARLPIIVLFPSSELLHEFRVVEGIELYRAFPRI
jgi:hypothetical protein